MSVYLGEWAGGGQAAMLADFLIDASALDGAEVLVASYDTPPYEGYAFVLIERGGELYEINGSHCSCYGLGENSYYESSGTQWSPEPVDTASLLHRAQTGSILDAETSNAVLAVLLARDAAE